jgi:hypothetical protein
MRKSHFNDEFLVLLGPIISRFFACSNDEKNIKGCIQISLFNETDHTKSISFYIKWRQVKTDWGVSGREGEREREKQIKEVRDRA